MKFNGVHSLVRLYGDINADTLDVTSDTGVNVGNTVSTNNDKSVPQNHNANINVQTMFTANLTGNGKFYVDAANGSIGTPTLEVTTVDGNIETNGKLIGAFTNDDKVPTSGAGSTFKFTATGKGAITHKGSIYADNITLATNSGGINAIEATSGFYDGTASRHGYESTQLNFKATSTSGNINLGVTQVITNPTANISNRTVKLAQPKGTSVFGKNSTLAPISVYIETKTGTVTLNSDLKVTDNNRDVSSSATPPASTSSLTIKAKTIQSGYVTEKTANYNPTTKKVTVTVTGADNYTLDAGSGILHYEETASLFTAATPLVVDSKHFANIENAQSVTVKTNASINLTQALNVANDVNLTSTGGAVTVGTAASVANGNKAQGANISANKITLIAQGGQVKLNSSKPTVNSWSTQTTVLTVLGTAPTKGGHPIVVTGHAPSTNWFNNPTSFGINVSNNVSLSVTP